MTLTKSIYIDKSHQEILDYVNKVDFFEDFLREIDPEEYEIITETDIETNSVTWPVKILFKDKPDVPMFNVFIPFMNIEHNWSLNDNIIKVNIKSKVCDRVIFEMKFVCTISYLGDIEINGEWISKALLVPHGALQYVLDQFEGIIKKIFS